MNAGQGLKQVLSATLQHPSTPPVHLHPSSSLWKALVPLCLRVFTGRGGWKCWGVYISRINPESMRDESWYIATSPSPLVCPTISQRSLGGWHANAQRSNQLIDSLPWLTSHSPINLPRIIHQKNYLCLRDFPCGQVAKTLLSQCRGPRFDPWSGN